MEEQLSQPYVQKKIKLSLVSAISEVSVVERSPFCSGVISVSLEHSVAEVCQWPKSQRDARYPHLG